MSGDASNDWETRTGARREPWLIVNDAEHNKSHNSNLCCPLPARHIPCHNPFYYTTATRGTTPNPTQLFFGPDSFIMNLNFINLAKRDGTPTGPALNGSMLTLLIVLLALVVVALLLIAGLLFMRQRKRARKNSLPRYSEKRLSNASLSSSHRRVLARPSELVHVNQEKLAFIHGTNTPPDSPAIPEIRITFPDEKDDAGKRISGRVVVVRVGDHNVDLEPVTEDNLPAYAEKERFDSLDLDQIGGLVEKARNAPVEATR